MIPERLFHSLFLFRSKELWTLHPGFVSVFRRGDAALRQTRIEVHDHALSGPTELVSSQDLETHRCPHAGSIKRVAECPSGHSPVRYELGGGAGHATFVL